MCLFPGMNARSSFLLDGNVEKKELLVMAAPINKALSSAENSVTVLVEKKRCTRVASEDTFIEEEVINDRELSYEYEDEFEEGGEDQRGAVDDSVKQYLKEIGMYPLLTAEQEL